MSRPWSETDCSGQANNAALQISAGRAVVILRVPPNAAPYIEGRAVVIQHFDGNRHWVRFEGDPAWCLRAVYPALQANAEAIAAALIELWRAEQVMSASIDDFFPSSNSDNWGRL